MPHTQKKQRYFLLDALRGLTLLSMAAYHAAWDLVWLFGVDWPWYKGSGAFLWQQSICWTFILLSGFCLPMGRNPVRRGALVSLCGLAVTGATALFMPESLVVFGVLSFIGAAMIVAGLTRSLWEKIPAGAGLAASAALFAVFRGVNEGFLGFGAWRIASLPRALYRNTFTTALGFPAPDFYSTDYFSLLPWIFLFGCGIFLYRLAAARDLLRFLRGPRLPVLEFLGRHSLVFYMLHQPVLYGVLYLGFVLL